MLLLQEQVQHLLLIINSIYIQSFCQRLVLTLIQLILIIPNFFSCYWNLLLLLFFFNLGQHRKKKNWLGVGNVLKERHWRLCVFIISISAKKGVSLHYQISTKTKTNIFELFSFSQFIQAFPSVKERVRERERDIYFIDERKIKFMFSI